MLSKYRKPFFWLAIIAVATFGLAYLRDKRALALLALNYGTDTANPNYVFLNGKVNGCDVRFFYDSGATNSTINQADTAKCLSGTKPAGTKKIATNAGIVDQKYYNISLQLPDGNAFNTTIVSDNGLYSALSPKDLTTIYDITQTAAGVNLTPKGTTTPIDSSTSTDTTITPDSGTVMGICPPGFGCSKGTCVSGAKHTSKKCNCPAGWILKDGYCGGKPKKSSSSGPPTKGKCPSGQKLVGGICHSTGFKPSGGDIQKSLCAASGMIPSGQGCAPKPTTVPLGKAGFLAISYS